MPPKKRSPYGSGTKPAQRKDGLWVARIEAGYTTRGTRRRIVVSAKTEAECKRRLKAKQRELANRKAPAAGRARATVKTWTDEWLPIYQGEVKPTVYRTNASLVRRWIVPELGHIRLTDLMPYDIRAMHRAMISAGRSSTTAMHAHTLLMRMLRAARIDGHDVAENVFDMNAPQQAISDRDAIPVDGLKRILAVARDGDDFARWVASMLNGTRRGETLGLTWECVDLQRLTLDISWQLQNLPYADKRDRSKGFVIPPKYEARHLTGAVHLLRPKSVKSRRMLPLVPWLHGELLALRETWQDNPWDLIWSEQNGRGQVIPRRLNQDRLAWHALQEAAKVAHPAGRPYHLHEARHATATILLEEGVDEHVRMMIMGHSSIDTTRGYQHVSQDLARHALGMVAGRLTAEPSVVDDTQVSALGS